MSSIGLDDLPRLATALRTETLALEDLLDALEKTMQAREGTVHAFMAEPGRFERLRRQAADLVARFPDPATRPPLYGVPVGVKDIFHVDGLPTSGGSKLPPAVLAGPEAASVTALGAAGALVLGKTVSTEFAYFAPGPTRNPHALDHTPGGSSSGSAAAVGAGLCPLALGTQTIGSISRPAAFCGVVGYKPSYERVPRDGVIPLAPSLDHVGVLTTSAAGAFLAASVLLSDWRGGDGQLEAPAGRPVCGVPVGPYLERASATALACFRDCCAALEGAGYGVKEVAAMEDFDAIKARHDRIVAAEAAAVHAEWYPQFRERYHDKSATLIEKGQQISAETLAQDLAGRAVLRQELSALMDAHGLDLWLSPPAPGPAPAGLASTGDPVMNLPWTHCGLPTLCLPVGRTEDGLPMGLQVAGRWQQDETLLAWGEPLAEAVATVWSGS